LPAGALLPSEAALTEEFGVSRPTVRAALSLLEDAGRIEVLPGQGRRVVGAGEADAQPASAYESIAQELRARIAAGEFETDSPLPSEATLMRQFGVSRNTVRRAYAVLADQGLVVVRHGLGAFVAVS
jgi:DNA-binding GntR family transcriptional regulator